MKFTSNRKDVENLGVDLLGYIFYPPSKRYIGEVPEPGLMDSALPGVGVFVDESVPTILKFARSYGLTHVQLHGKEKPETCRILKRQGLKVIKAFSVNSYFNFENTEQYEKTVNLFLFDTKTEIPGGSGKKFDWNILEKYQGHIPFLLSGGIRKEDAESIRKIKHKKITGVDLNSGFEDSPGMKNIQDLEQFINTLYK